MNLPVSLWETQHDAPISEEAIRRSLQHPGRYRISSHRYAADTLFPGAMRPGTIYVLEGQCQYAFEDIGVSLSVGQFAEVPGGRYRFQTKDGARVVCVWPLPREFWR